MLPNTINYGLNILSDRKEDDVIKIDKNDVDYFDELNDSELNFDIKKKNDYVLEKV